MSASFQKTVSEILIFKLEKALNNFISCKKNISSFSIVGGVANNLYIRKSLEKIAKKNNLQIYYPINEMLSDNAAMIAWACIKKFNKKFIDLNFRPEPRLKI